MRAICPRAFQAAIQLLLQVALPSARSFAVSEKRARYSAYLRPPERRRD